MWSTSRQLPTGTPPNEGSGPLAEFIPLTGYDPKLPDNVHYLETPEIIFRDESSDAVPSYILTRNSTMRPSAERSLHHSSFRSEKNQRTEDKLITPMKKVCCQLGPLSVCHARTGRPVHELSSPSSRSREKPSREVENETIRVLLERQKEQILADFRAEIHKREFQADSEKRSIQELSGIIESQRRENYHTLACDEQLRRDQLLLHEQLSEQNRDLREAHTHGFSGNVFVNPTASASSPYHKGSIRGFPM